MTEWNRPYGGYNRKGRWVGSDTMKYLKTYTAGLLYNTAKHHKLISGVILTALISALGFGSYLGFSG